MLKNYITIAINNLFKNKLYSAINIAGLAIGLSACILITLYVRDELSYDRQWEKADLIYMVSDTRSFGSSPLTTVPYVSAITLPTMQKYFPEDIDIGTRVQGKSGEFQIGDVNYAGIISLVDEEFTKIFQVEVLNGNLEKTYKNPGNIALSEESANKYFGDTDPIGETITFKLENGNEEQYQVTAVYRFISTNTVLNIPSFSLFNKAGIEANWDNLSCRTYIRFYETADINKIVDRLPEFIDQNIPTQLQPNQKLSDSRGYSLQKINDIYFNPVKSPFGPTAKSGNMKAIRVFILISVLVLIIGCINYVILSTAKATQRAREVAMRKVVGARFKQLLLQFLGESMLITLIAFLLASGIVELFFPFFEVLVSKNLSIPYSSAGSYLFALLLLIVVGLFGGFYPALVLSGYSPSKALKAKHTTEAEGSSKLKNILVIFQFTASIALIIATIVVYFQLLYTSKHDPGFSPEKLLVLENIERQNVKLSRNALQQELLKLPSIKSIALSTIQPMSVGRGIQAFLPFRSKKFESTPSQEILLNNMYVDFNFFDVYGIPLLSGRYFMNGVDKEEPTPFPNLQTENNGEIKERRIIINFAAARHFGFASSDEAIGKILEFGQSNTPVYSEYTIVGVVADSQYRSLRLKPEPEIYHLCPDAATFLTISYKGDYQTIIKEVKRIWNSVIGNYPLRESSVTQNMATTFNKEKQENKVLIAFALLSIFIACMGLYGMAAFTVDRRVKEIGLRKVMGAKVNDIVKLLSWRLLKPVLIANIIAWPVAIYAMQNWLERFPYTFSPVLLIPICLASGLITLAIAGLTVAGNTKRVAKTSPIHSLRYE